MDLLPHLMDVNKQSAILSNKPDMAEPTCFLVICNLAALYLTSYKSLQARHNPVTISCFMSVTLNSFRDANV